MPRLPAALLAAALACAGRQSWTDVAPPEVLVDVLPRGALLEVDGRALGPGSRAVAVPDPGHLYRFRASSAGYEPAEAERPGARLAGTRLGLLLRPAGFGRARALDLDDPVALSQAAAATLRGGHAADAVDYARRALELRDVPLAHRVLGEAYARLGQRQTSIREYSAYLAAAPDAPDAPAIAAEVERARGDLTVPAPKE